LHGTTSIWIIIVYTDSINAHYDRANNRLEIITVEGYRITFDLSTGIVLSQIVSPEHVPPNQTNRIFIAVVPVLVALIIFGVLVVIIKKRKKRLN